MIQALLSILLDNTINHGKLKQAACINTNETQRRVIDWKLDVFRAGERVIL